MEQISIVLTSMQVGGAQRIALNLCTGLVQNGHKVDLVLTEAKGQLLNELPESVTVVDLNASRVSTSIFSLRKYLRERSPDVLYSMMIEINIAAIIGHQLSGVDTRLVISEHNTPTVSADGPKDWLALRLASLLYPQADHVVTVSRGVRDDLLNVVDLPEEKVSVIYNPIDVEHIRELAAEPLNHDWLTDPSTPVVMSAGRHAPQKGFDTLLRAFTHLSNQDVRLVLLGEGEETESLRELAIELDIEDRVDFPGFVDNPFKYIGKADVFVLSSWYEGFGNVLIEAMAAGCPVVATDCPSGPNEILDNGKYGSLVPIRDPVSMSEAIENVLQDPPEFELISERSNAFSVECVIHEYEKVFSMTIDT